MIFFDLDGTLADCSHRKHFVTHNKSHGFDQLYELKEGKWIHKHTGEKFVPDWQSFYEACDQDIPIDPTIRIMNQFLLMDGMEESFDLQIWSGRCESVRLKTLIWLENTFDIYGHDTYFFDSILKMRPIGYYTPDDQLKERWLDEALAQGKTIDFVIDDHKKVIDMYLRRGIFVFDVAQGKGDF